MTLQDRDYVTGKHPPYCTCVTCVEARLERINRPGLLKRILKKIFRR
jgi:hypothetical protein